MTEREYRTVDGVTLKPGDTFYEAGEWTAQVRVRIVGFGEPRSFNGKPVIPVKGGCSHADAARSFSTWDAARQQVVADKDREIEVAYDKALAELTRAKRAKAAAAEWRAKSDPTSSPQSAEKGAGR